MNPPEPVQGKLKSQKPVRSNLARLTEETIRAKTKKGDTPLHRAAKTGRICEIPSYLLQTDLFLLTNDDGKTPLHVAAEHGHLDQVPRAFLTNETLAIRTSPHYAPYGVYTTGKGCEARTETVLHIAARCGYGAQIPVEFLTPKLLSIEATGNRGTVLHDLAYAKRLDVVPNIYAGSPMWRLQDNSGQTPRDIFNALIEQECRQRKREAWRPPRITLPIQTELSKLLPVFSDESLRAIEVKSTDRSKTYIVNLLDYTCTCPLCLELHSGVPPQDFARLCKHIIIALREKHLIAQLPPIAKGIAENGYPEAFGVYPGHFAKDLNGKPVYITGRNYDGWVNVFAQWGRDGVNYYRFGYHVDSKGWYYRSLSYLYQPKIDESVLY